MGEPERQFEPIDLLEFKRRLLTRTMSSSNSTEDPLAELARIIGGGGRIIPADATPRDEASSGRRTPYSAQAARPPRTNLEPVQWPDWSDDDQSPRDTAVASPLSDRVALEASAHEERRSHVDGVPYSNENILVASDDDARLRLHNRRQANVPLFVTAAAVVVVGVLAILIFRPGGSALPPADHRTDIAAVATPQPTTANSTPETRLNSSASATASADGGAQLSSPLQPNPAVNMGAAVAPAPAAANSSPLPQDADMFPPPKRVHTVPVHSDGTIGEPPNIAPDGAQAAPANIAPAGPQAAPAPGLTFGQVVEAQKFQMPAAARDGAGPTNGPALDVAAVELPKVAARPAAHPAAQPAPSVAAAGTTYAAILASPTSESAARGMFVQMQKKYGAALGTHRLTFHRAKGAEGTVYEVRVAGLVDDEAQALCAKLSSAGAACQVEPQ